MKILIDMQGAQTASRFRGIGRYTISLTKAIIANKKKTDDVYLLINGSLKEGAKYVKLQFKSLLDSQYIKTWYPSEVQESLEGGVWRRTSEENIRDAVIQNINPDIVLVSSIFEGYPDNVISTINNMPEIKQAVILYDLIPYSKPDYYLVDTTYSSHYYRKINDLKNSDLLLGISQSSCQEAIDLLGIEKSKVVNISSAKDDIFTPSRLSLAEEKNIKLKYGAKRDIILYAPGGFDIRKNFENLIKAYAMLDLNIRNKHQLMIVSKISDNQKDELLKIAQSASLKKDELLLPGYVVDDDLIKLYSCAKLFVFASFHEGFGLPVLEAMSCGAPVIGSNTTSVPEVIGNKDALFDPYSIEDIHKKIKQAIVDDNFRKLLKEKAEKQINTFSWDISAKRALDAFDLIVQKKEDSKLGTLAFISPIPPAKSGIAIYSQELLSYLGKYYDITVIVDSEADICDSQASFGCQIKTSNWFIDNSSCFDRVIYQIGNSSFHSYAIDLLKKVSGIVVLHDFFLSDLMAWRENCQSIEFDCLKALFSSHGYLALFEFQKSGFIDTIKQYPANFEIFTNSSGVIIHSEYAKSLVKYWYGKQAYNDCAVVPLLRIPKKIQNKKEAKHKLGFNEKDFIICSFGFVDEIKEYDVILDAWLKSTISSNQNCYLVFVGDKNNSEYVKNLEKLISNCGYSKRIYITGWVDDNVYNNYLFATDIAIQLRKQSKGETSAAALDCLLAKVPLIVNQVGSMAEMPKEFVYMLNENYSTQDLTNAIDKLYSNTNFYSDLNSKFDNYAIGHSPQECAKQYYSFIESKYCNYQNINNKLISKIKNINIPPANNNDVAQIASSINININKKRHKKTLYIDISNVVNSNLHSGIERFARAQIVAFIDTIPKDTFVEPVYLDCVDGVWAYRYARTYMMNTFSLINIGFSDDIVDFMPNDILYCVDYFRDGFIEATKSGLFKWLKSVDVKINCVVFDLLPITNPEFFPDNSHLYHAIWLECVLAVSDNIICISQTISNELKTWISENNLKTDANIDFALLGCDINNSIPTHKQNDTILPVDTFDKLTFLMVGTIEPRKGYLQVLNAFNLLWEQGYDINLVIVGKEGWKSLPDTERRTIPLIISSIMQNKQLNSKLFWLEDVSDEYLNELYKQSSCLIMASEGEGFGLPIVEASSFGLPLILRDIPIFREIAADNALYFKNNNNHKTIYKAVKNWMLYFKNNTHKKPDLLNAFTWKQNVGKVVKILDI